MEGLRQYVISVTAAALLCAALTGMTRKSPAGELIRMLCGLVLTFTVLYPISRVKLAEMTIAPPAWEGESMAAQGEKIARETLRDIIKSDTEAYILDKAAALDLSVRVKVSLSEDTVPVPVGVILSGAVSPYARSQLTNVIEKELGIPKENQLWTG